MNTKAIEALARVLLIQNDPFGNWHKLPDPTQTNFLAKAMMLIDAALPFIEEERRTEILNDVRQIKHDAWNEAVVHIYGADSPEYAELCVENPYMEES